MNDYFFHSIVVQGCKTLALVPSESSFRIVSRIPLTRLPIRVLGSKSNGWHDLRVWVAADVLRLIDHAHTTAAELFDNAVMRKGLTDHGKRNIMWEKEPSQ